ncbi:MAG: CsbD family protein [Steroidobacteraceae bacterium]
MNRDRIEGNWKQLKGKVRTQWGRLTDDDVDQIEGQYEILAGRLQEAYGISRDEADKRIKDWEDEVADRTVHKSHN